MSKQISVNERAQHFLKTLVELYIQDGTPVGSRTLSRQTGLELSPATVRNVMSDLEDMGMVSSPHTSAGRIPTLQGYRVFLDSLLTVNPMSGTDVQSISEQIGHSDDANAIVQSASRVLSGITGMAGVVMVPSREYKSLKRIEFLPLSDRRVLTILVSSDGDVQNQIIHTHKNYSQEDLERASNYLNNRFAGSSLQNIRDEIKKELGTDRQQMEEQLAAAMEVASPVLNESSEESCVISGETNLMGCTDLGDMDHLRDLFEAFAQKHEIIQLLDECMTREGVQIYFGEESGYKPLNGCSVVTCPYEVEEQVVGVLGVIGPTRMAYDKVIPVVDVTAKLLGAALKSS